MTGAFQWVLKTYGQVMVCYDRDGQTLGSGAAIVQPMTEADWQYTAGALGSYRTDRFLCLAEPSLPLDETAEVSWGGRKYEPLTVRPIWVGDRVTHLWAALRPAEEMGL